MKKTNVYKHNVDIYFIYAHRTLLMKAKTNIKKEP